MARGASPGRADRPSGDTCVVSQCTHLVSRSTCEEGIHLRLPLPCLSVSDDSSHPQLCSWQGLRPPRTGRDTALLELVGAPPS